MNRIFLIACLAICITAFQSCKKESLATGISNSIIGNWELRTTSAAMMPAPTNYPPGNGNILRFTGTTYEQYQNGQLVKTGTYAIIPDATVGESVCLVMPAGQFTFRIIYDNNYNTDKEFIHISNNTLNFISGCYAYDAGHTKGYARIDDN